MSEFSSGIRWEERGKSQRSNGLNDPEEKDQTKDLGWTTGSILLKTSCLPLYLSSHPFLSFVNRRNGGSDPQESQISEWINVPLLYKCNSDHGSFFPVQLVWATLYIVASIRLLLLLTRFYFLKGSILQELLFKYNFFISFAIETVLLK